jgi:AcrR family transcriptional regulator
MNTRGKILDKALEMFNERGIEYVGLRELAAILDMRVGNITYYFPTKDDLIYELSQELAQKNSEVIITAENLTMIAFLDMMKKVFLNHVQFKCLLLSFVHLMQQNKLIKTAYKKTQRTRSATIKSNLETLATSGYLKVDQEGDLDFLVSAISLISRFWVSEAAVSFRELNTGEQIRHYLLLITKLLLPYSTPKAKKEISGFVEGL